LRKQIERYQKFATTATPLLLKGKLAGATVALVQTGDYPNALTNVREALQEAGARVLSATTIERSFGRPDEVLQSNLATLRAKDTRFPADRDGLARALANIFAHGDTNGFLSALEREEFVHSEEGSVYATPVRYVVLVAGR